MNEIITAGAVLAAIATVLLIMPILTNPPPANKGVPTVRGAQVPDPSSVRAVSDWVLRCFEHGGLRRREVLRAINSTTITFTDTSTGKKCEAVYTADARLSDLDSVLSYAVVRHINKRIKDSDAKELVETLWRLYPRDYHTPARR